MFLQGGKSREVTFLANLMSFQYYIDGSVLNSHSAKECISQALKESQASDYHSHMPVGVRTCISGHVALELDVLKVELWEVVRWGEWYYSAYILQGWFQNGFVALDFDIIDKELALYPEMVIASGSIKAVPQAADARR